MTLWLSKLELKRSPEIAALAGTLMPGDPAQAVATDHRLVWSVFADGPERERDFLWRREERPGRFLALSRRKPREDGALFDVATKPFEPVLAPGDRLAFALKFNPTVERKGVGRTDVVMDLLKPTPSGERAAVRLAYAQEATEAWLRARTERDGFALHALIVDGYRVERFGRTKRRRGSTEAGIIGVVDARGVLEVRDPTAFLARLAAGFGRAKAFGCGLMLIRRAPGTP